MLIIFLSRFKSGETGCNDGNFNLILNIGVDACTEDDVCRRVYNAADKFCRIGNLFECEVVAADDVEDDAACTLDSRFKQRAVYGYADGFDDSVVALSDAYAEVSNAPVLENGFDIGKVEVDERGVDDKFGDAPYALLEYFVCNAQSFYHRRILLHDSPYLVVGNNYKGIYIFFKIFKTLCSVFQSLSAFKGKRLGNNGNGEDLHIPCNLCDYRCGARTCAAAHACRYKQKVRTFNKVG